jgi:hypothetical protein
LYRSYRRNGCHGVNRLYRGNRYYRYDGCHGRNGLYGCDG